MLLHDLIEQFDPRASVRGLASIDVTGIREDSRLVCPGDLFIARPGPRGAGRFDGRQFVSDARDRGAVAAVVSEPCDAPLPQVVVSDPARAASALAHLFHGLPASRVATLGITGTNGKTTTAYLLRHILAAESLRCGLIGTVEIDDGRQKRESSMTTPGACEVAELLATMRDRGCRACAMEVSSHALDQHRVAGVDFAGAAFTNLTGDHLDYHGTMDDYAGAKARLFESLAPESAAAVNDDDPWTPRLVRDCRARIIRFGFGETADYRAREVTASAEGTRFILSAPGGQAEVRTPLIGRHNVENALAAAALAGEALHLPIARIAAALRDATGAPGRLQPVSLGQPFAVLVDYAHTDDALRNVLQALRPVTRGKLRVLFGCGGDRDRTKRPRMAQVAEKLADALYVTSDNPRTEDPRTILAEVTAGLSRAGQASAFVEVERRAAIERILGDAAEGDVVLIAGKGHENYQIVGAEKRRFDDVEEASRALARWAGA